MPSWLARVTGATAGAAHACRRENVATTGTALRRRVAVVVAAIGTAATTVGAEPAREPALAQRSARAHLLALRVATERDTVRITLVGDAPLHTSQVTVARDLPPRILLDLPGVAAPGIPSATSVGGPAVFRVRVAMHSWRPMVTRVVVDLRHATPYRVERHGTSDRELQVIVGASAAEQETVPPLAPPPAGVADAPAPVPTAPDRAALLALPEPRLDPPSLPGPVASPPPVPSRPAPTTGGREPLVAGLQVKVEGHQRDDGRFDAVQVVVRNVEDTVKAEGRVTAVGRDRRAFSLLGFQVVVPADAALYRGSRPGASRAEIAVGTWLEVKGRRRDATIVAERIRIKDDAEATEELEATIDRIEDDGSLVVLGRHVRVPAAAAIVDQRTAIEADTRLRRDDDEQSRAPIRLGSRIVVGGRVESAWVEESNLELADAGARRDRWVSRLQGLASVQLTGSIEAYAKVAVNRSALLLNGGVAAAQDSEVQEAYVLAHRVGGSAVSVQVGRQRFRDGREWFYDEYLDAVRVTAAVSGWTFEAAVAEGLFAGPVAGRDRKDKRHQLASITRAFAGTKVGAFAIRRDDRGPVDDDPSWLGATTEVKTDGGSRLWALATLRRGHRGSTTLGGWAMDAGATLVFADVPSRPAVTAGFARASGDTISGDGRDTTFRQTDLEDNSARLGGLRRITYYGELFDPELSNLQVLTAGVGVRPARTIGVDVVWHGYAQSVLRGSIPSSAFDLDATGKSGLLGHELDAAVTVRAGRFDIDLAAGLFVAGPGLAPSRRVAYFWRPQVRLYF